MKILCLADTHVGSRFAVWPENYTLSEGGTHGGDQMPPQQRWLNKCWNVMATRVREWKPDVVVIVGDVIDGVAVVNQEVITTDFSDQSGAAVELIAPIIPDSAEVFVIKGTPFHEGLCSSMTRDFARQIGAVPNEDGNPLRAFLILDTPGGAIFFSHHGTGGSFKWTQTASAERNFMTLQAEMLRTWGKDAPRLMGSVTAHTHTGGESSPIPGTCVMRLPCWQLPNAYARKRVPFSMPDIGYGIIEATEERGLQGDIIQFRLPVPEVTTVGNRVHRSNGRDDESTVERPVKREFREPTGTAWYDLE